MQYGPDAAVEGTVDVRAIAMLLARCLCNAHTVCDSELRPRGIGLFLQGALLNHSDTCAPFPLLSCLVSVSLCSREMATSNCPQLLSVLIALLHSRVLPAVQQAIHFHPCFVTAFCMQLGDFACLLRTHCVRAHLTAEQASTPAIQRRCSIL